MEKKQSARAQAKGLIFGVPVKIIVLIEGLAIGPFETSVEALAWAYDHSRNGIYTLKELIDPMMEI